MLKINNFYFVQVEDKNLTLQRINGIDKRSGKPKYSIIGYFSNWQVLFDKLIKLFVADKVNMEDTILLSQLKEIYEDVRKEIKVSPSKVDNFIIPLFYRSEHPRLYNINSQAKKGANRHAKTT